MSHCLLRSALISCLPLFVATPAFCLQSSSLYFRYRDATNWPPALGAPATMTRCVSGDFTGDGLIDAFALVGGHPILVWAPDTWSSVALVDPTFVCNDFDSIPYPGDMQAGLITVGASGLVELTYQSAPAGFQQYLRSSDPIWTTATLVKRCDLNANGNFDFVGLCPAHDQVPTKIAVLTDGGSPVGHTTTFSLPGITVYDIGIVKYDGTGVGNIMTLDSYGVEVFTAGGSRIKRFARPTTTMGDAFCTFMKGGDVREHIAWFRIATDPSKQELAELHWDSDPNVQQWMMATGTYSASDRVVRAVSIASSTSVASQNVNSDILVSHLGSYEPYRLHYLSSPIGSATFKLSPIELLGDPSANPDPTLISGSANMAPFVVDDFSNDGVPDLLLPVQDGSNFLYFLTFRGSSQQPDSDPTHIYYDGAANFLGGPVLNHTASGSGLNKLDLRITFDPPLAADANALEISVWSCAPGTGPVTYTAVNHYFFQDSSGNYPLLEGLYAHVRFGLQLTDTAIPPNNTSDAPCFAPLYWMTVCQSHRETGTLIFRPKSAVYVGILGSIAASLTPWSDVDGTSRTACMDISQLGSPCDSGGCIVLPGGGQSAGSTTVVAPGAMSRHRMAPTGGGNPPAPPTAQSGELIAPQ